MRRHLAPPLPPPSSLRPSPPVFSPPPLLSSSDLLSGSEHVALRPLDFHFLSNFFLCGFIRDRGLTSTRVLMCRDFMCSFLDLK
ncbi:hypothetical protein JHK82_014410 [Glycine max]|nr:hypothetical protein JHK87_014321 [Glycine soja]KAG5045031.1 hypothetical protein JHK86_014437 [Glycine max]KAG5147529.1 hypothetical protein JHK82_014410 [Glycine max]